MSGVKKPRTKKDKDKTVPPHEFMQRQAKEARDTRANFETGASGNECEAGVRTGVRKLEGGERETDRNGSTYPPCWWNSMACWPFFPARLLCLLSSVELRNSSEFRLKPKQSEAFSAACLPAGPEVPCFERYHH